VHTVAVFEFPFAATFWITAAPTMGNVRVPVFHDTTDPLYPTDTGQAHARPLALQGNLNTLGSANLPRWQALAVGA
jgi:hypothetical protein